MQDQDIQQSEGTQKDRRNIEKSGTAISAMPYLKAQHREVEELFAKIENTSERSVKTRERLFAEIADKLTLHAKIEEAIFYPAVQDVDSDLVFEAHEEHDNVKAMIRKLKRTEGGDETFAAKVTVLKELVNHHVKEEEEELFPKCEKYFSRDELTELGEKLQTKYEMLQRTN